VTAVVAARGRAAESLNPLHAGPGVGFSDAFLLLAVPLLIGLALSAAVPGPAVAEQKVGGSGRG
jgi:hypothetical protein